MSIKIEAAKIAIGIYTEGQNFEDAVKTYRKKENKLDYAPISDWSVGRIRQDVKKETEVAEEYDIDLFFYLTEKRKRKRVKVSKIMYYTVEKKRIVKRPVYIQFVYTGDDFEDLLEELSEEYENSTVDGVSFPDWWKENLNKIIPEKIGKFLYEDLQGKGKYVSTGNPMGRPSKTDVKPRPSRAKAGAVMGRPKKQKPPVITNLEKAKKAGIKVNDKQVKVKKSVGRPKKPPPPTEIDGLKVLTKANKGITVGVKKKFYPVKVITAKKQLTQKQLDGLAKARAAKKKKNTISQVSAPKEKKLKFNIKKKKKLKFNIIKKKPTN